MLKLSAMLVLSVELDDEPDDELVPLELEELCELSPEYTVPTTETVGGFSVVFLHPVTAVQSKNNARAAPTTFERFIKTTSVRS